LIDSPEVARETNIFSLRGRKMLLGLDLARDEKGLLEARIMISAAF
jgi:hypothetical protein